MFEAGKLTPSAKIAIVGSGAIGCYYGARLAQSGHNVHFLMRSDLAAVQANGLTIRSVVGDFHLNEVNCHGSTEEIGPCDLVIIALKSTANDNLGSLLKPLIHDQTVVLTLQNGLGNEEKLAALVGGERVMGGLCFVCINRTGPGVIEHIAQGQINLGEFSGGPQERTHAIAESLRQSQIPCNVETSLPLARWCKLVWNIPFNGLSIAAGGVDTEVMLADPALSRLIKDLMLEVISAAARLDLHLPPSLADDMIENTRRMGAYKTSSLIDYLDGKDVELDTIWLEPCRQAMTAGATVPRLEMLCDLLRFRLNQNRQ